MKKILLLLCCLPLLTATTCNDDDRSDGINCTLEARAALNVTVSLGDSSANVSEGITVVATDGDFSETLQTFIEGDPTFSGAYERTGNYILTVSKEGYQTYTSAAIAVTKDRCHVIPRIVHVTLQPL